MTPDCQQTDGQPAAAADWTCWVKQAPGQRWHQVGTAPTEADAWRLVLKCPAASRTISRPGGDPNRSQLAAVNAGEGGKE